MALSPIAFVGLSNHFSFLLLSIVKLSLKLEATYESQSAQSHGNRDYYPYSCHVIVGFQSELNLVFSCFECILVWFLLSRFLFLYLHLNSVGLFVCIWGALGSLWKYMLTINAFMVLSKKGKAKVSNFFHNFVFFLILTNKPEDSPLVTSPAICAPHFA